MTTTNLIIFLTRSSGMIGNKPFDFFFPRFFVCVQNKHSSIIKKITKQKNINISIEVKKGIGKSSAHALPFSKLYCFVVFFLNNLQHFRTFHFGGTEVPKNQTFFLHGCSYRVLFALAILNYERNFQPYNYNSYLLWKYMSLTFLLSLPLQDCTSICWSYKLSPAMILPSKCTRSSDGVRFPFSVAIQSYF